MDPPWQFKHPAFLICGMKVLYTQNSSSYTASSNEIRQLWNARHLESPQQMRCTTSSWPGVGKEKGKKNSKFSTCIWVVSRLWLKVPKNGNSPNPQEKYIPYTPFQGMRPVGEWDFLNFARLFCSLQWLFIFFFSSLCYRAFPWRYYFMV